MRMAIGRSKIKAEGRDACNKQTIMRRKKTKKQTITRTNKQTNNYENKKSAKVKVKSKVEERIKTCKSEWKKDSSTNKRPTDGDG